MQFEYQAKSRAGQVSSGTLDARTPTEARQILRQKGLFALHVGEKKKSTGSREISLFKSQKITKRDLLMVTSQLGIMVQAGVELAEAIANVWENCPHPQLKDALGQLLQEISDGDSVTAAMQRQVDVFGSAFVACIAAGEVSGTLEQVLQRLTELLQNEVRLRSTIRSVMAYPIILMGISGLVMLSLIFFVLPQFAKVFQDLDKPAPAMTQFLLDGATTLRSHGLIVLALGAGCLFGFYKLLKTEQAKVVFDRLLLTTKFTKAAASALIVGRLFRLIGTLVQTRVPLLEAIQLSRSATGSRAFRKLLDDIEREIMRGSGMAMVLQNSAIVPPEAAQMVATAEKTGRLGPILVMVGDFYEEEGQKRVKEVARLFEPLVIALMGLVVVVVVMAVILPLLDVSTVS